MSDIVIENVTELLEKLVTGNPVEISFNLFAQFLVAKGCLFKNCIIDNNTVSHAHQSEPGQYSKRIYFYEKKVDGDWKYYAELASSYHLKLAS